jgi:outer membrane protein assembly factor BamB
VENNTLILHRAARAISTTAFVLAFLLQPLASLPTAAAATDNWPTYLHDPARTSASSDTTVSAANAATLALKWSAQTGGVIASSASVSGGVVYVGSWDGYEYALNAVTGAVMWQTFLGITTANPICVPPQAGVSSAPAITGGVVYLGGGDDYWYALDAATGQVLWKIYIGESTAAGGNYNWASPLVVGNYAYIGVASLGDCPLVQGKLLKVNLTTHAVEATTNLVPDGQVGGGIWTSPAYDTAANTIFLTTGTENAVTQQYAQAVVAIDAATMNITQFWKLPENVAVLDSDFGNSPILYTDAGNRPLLVSINKNGIAYAFDRRNLAAGPVWQQTVAIGGDCPTCGEASVSGGALGGGRLYLAGETTTVGGTGYQGSVRALDPATGAILWERPTTGPVIGALAYANGLVYSGSGSVLEAIDAASGHVLYSYNLGSPIYGSPVIAGGTIYIGNLAGKVFAIGLGTPTMPPADPNCPAGWTCQDLGTPAPAGTETASGGAWTLRGGGTGLGGTADSGRIATTIRSGDVQVSAQVTAQTNTAAGAQAGVILRQNNSPGSPFYAAYVTPNNVTVQNSVVRRPQLQHPGRHCPPE